MNDLHQFDPSNLMWTDLSSIHGQDSDSPPQARYSLCVELLLNQKRVIYYNQRVCREQFGFAASGENLYLFGGKGNNGRMPSTPLPTLIAAIFRV